MATQTIIVTGSTQGLGFGYACEFLRRGHNVVVSGRETARVEAAIKKLASACPGADGRIARIWDKVKVKGHAAEVLAAAQAL